MKRNSLIKVTSFLTSLVIGITFMTMPPQNEKYSIISIAEASTDVSNLNAIDSSYNFIKEQEGCSYECFWDNEQWTIGYGNKCPYEHSSKGVRGQKGGHTITETEARQLFDEKISRYVNTLKSNCKGLSMTQNQFDALLSATYNHGNVAQCPLKYYLTGDYSEAEARERYYVWCINAGTPDEKGLRARRKREADLFFSDIEKKWYDQYTPVNIGDDFYAQIKCEDNGCYLSNMDGNVGGANPIATKNQTWHFLRQDDGSYAILSYYDDLSMDVYAASTDNATNIQMMPYVGNTAQKFWIYSINGAYYFRPQCTEYPFTINRQNNDNLEVWYFDPTFTNKRFDIIKMDLDGNLPVSIGEDFYAQVVCEDGGCYLSNMDGNVGGADPIGTKNQIWHFKWLNDGSYSIISYYDGLSMDVAGAKTDNATNMQMMPYVENTAQKFWIYSINGAYYIRSQCNEYPFTINRQNNNNLELWYYDSTFANKRFDIIKMDCGGNLPINVVGSFNSDFYGKIKCNVNGKYLTNKNGNVQCYKDNDENNQIWYFKLQHDGSYSITSYEDEKSMDIYCAKQENGTNVQMMPYVGNTAQRFWIYNMNDAYYIQPLCSALPFTLNGDNLEIWIYDPTFENKKLDIIEVTPKSKVKGDCNNDGKFNISDVVMLQRWLLNSSTELTNWRVADLCEDGKLDVFDLCLVKHKLIYD